MTRNPAQAWAGLLGPDEHIVWQGRPAVRFAFRPADIALSGFGLMFFAFAIFWTVMAAGMSRGTGPFGMIFPLFGLPFIVVGAYLLFGRFFWDVFRRSRTWYTLTNRRAFIATDIFGNKTLRDYSIEPDAQIILTEENRYQSVTFAEHWQRMSKGRSQHITVAFELLRDGRDVYGMLLDIRQRARDAASGSGA